MYYVCLVLEMLNVVAVPISVIPLGLINNTLYKLQALARTQGPYF